MNGLCRFRPRCFNGHVKSNVVFGNKWHELNQLPELEHELFYEFLLLSPSYRLCHKLLLKEIECSKESLPPEWSLVEQTYSICGDIYAIGFEQWWVQTGHRIFSPRSNSKVIVALDFSRARKDLESELAELVEKGYQRTRQHPDGLRLLPSKIRVNTLIERRNLIYWKAVGESLPKPYLGYELAFLVNTPSAHLNKVKRLNKLSSLSIAARTQLTELISRQIREAKLIAENAARGKFPSKDKLLLPIDFDYCFIESRFGPNGYPFSEKFKHRDRMNHPIFKHLEHLKEREQRADSREESKKYPELEKLLQDFNQVLRRKR